MLLPLTLAGQTIGTVEVRSEKKDTAFTLRGRAQKGLYRAVLHGTGGTLPLGVWEGEAPLRRRFSREMTAPLGTPFRAEVLPCHRDSGWRSAPPERFHPWRTEGGLCRRRGGVWQLALPYSPDQPFPLPELVCLAKICTVEGQERAVFFFDDAMTPLMPDGK